MATFPPKAPEVADQIQAAPDSSSTADEKAEAIVTIGDIRVLGISAEDEAYYVGYPAEKRAKMIRKVRLVSLAPTHIAKDNNSSPRLMSA